MSDINITMKRNNGSGYDTLYPKTKQTLVDGLQQQITTRNVTIPASGWKISYDKKAWECGSSSFEVESDTNMVDLQADIATQLQLAEDGVYGIYAQFFVNPSYVGDTTIHGYPYFTVIGSIPPQHDVTLQVQLSSVPYNSSWPAEDARPMGIPIMTGIAPTVLDPILNNNTWAQIHKAADASIGANFWAVGDRKSVALSGTAGNTSFNTTLWVYIIGFNHNSAREGIGIAFQGFKTAQTGGTDVCLVASNYGSTGSGFVMNTTQTNTGGWNGSYAYKTAMAQIKNILPYDLRAVIRSTTLYTDNTGGGSTSASNVTSNSNEVYYLAEYEVFGVNTYANANEASYQQQYAYYQAGNSRIKYRYNATGTAAYWWLRSPDRSYSNSFCYVYSGGSANHGAATNSYGAAPTFKV